MKRASKDPKFSVFAQTSLYSIIACKSTKVVGLTMRRKPLPSLSIALYSCFQENNLVVLVANDATLLLHHC